MDEISYLRNRLEVKENEENRFQKYLLSLGIDKCIEMYEDITELIEYMKICVMNTRGKEQLKCLRILEILEEKEKSEND